MSSFSYVTKKDECKKLQLLETSSTSSTGTAVSFDIIKGSLTANNKFYIDFGNKPPFNFFKCYPVDPASTLIDSEGKHDDISNAYVHPVVWGIARVTSSNIETVHVGDMYMAMLPIGEHVSFDKAHVNKEGHLVVDRPTTNPAYNVFQKIHPNNALLNDKYSDLALACSPGIITGFGLFFSLTRNNFYGADTVVLTAASSKVSLALATYLKEFNDKVENEEDSTTTKKNTKIRIVGYTSNGNKDFCMKTGLYDEILGYDDVLSTDYTKCCMVDVSGKGEIYKNNKTVILKNLVVGNASGTPDEKSTFSSFTMYETIKLICTMMGLPTFLTRWMNPTQELYLIMNDAAALKDEWGLEKYNTTMIEYGMTFCKEATKWISIRTCDTEHTIEEAFVDIVNGSVPPTETIVLDVSKAAAGRKM